jgi:hypothetical protein
MAIASKALQIAWIRPAVQCLVMEAAILAGRGCLA